jgi:hypothetical protein
MSVAVSAKEEMWKRDRTEKRKRNKRNISEKGNRKSETEQRSIYFENRVTEDDVYRLLLHQQPEVK